jgi:ferredoxin-NADP reductase
MTATSFMAETAQVVVPDGDDDLVVLRCVQTLQVTHDVRTFVFEETRGSLGQRRAGQYLVLAVMVDGELLERCYTISSPPTRPFRVTITVKREPGGVVSNWLHDHLRDGLEVRARGPYGSFCPSSPGLTRHLFLSGGSGATPMMSSLRAFVDLGGPMDVAYVHSARSPVDILFRSELDHLASFDSPQARVAVAHICENDSDDEVWSGPKGRLTADVLLQLVPDVAEREVYACGPLPYLEAVREIVARLGVPDDHYHEESFVVSAPAPVPSADQPAAAVAGGFAVEFARSGKTVECEPGATLLTAALRAGIPLASSCGEGVCGTCKLSKLSGEVEMSHQGGIRPKEIAAGKILVCCSVPLSDVVLDG